jgi:hypothetical protein
MSSGSDLFIRYALRDSELEKQKNERGRTNGPATIHKSLQGHNSLTDIAIPQTCARVPTTNPPALTRVFTATACVLFEFVIFFLLDSLKSFVLHHDGRETDTESITTFRLFKSDGARRSSCPERQNPAVPMSLRPTNRDENPCLGGDCRPCRIGRSKPEPAAGVPDVGRTSDSLRFPTPVSCRFSTASACSIVECPISFSLVRRRAPVRVRRL